MTDENTSNTGAERFENVPWRRIANIVGLILLIAIVVPFVVFAVPQVVGADQGYVVLSGSMEPAMSPGDVVIVNSVPASQIERNDVITFGGQDGDTPTTHRVIEVVEQDGTPAFRTQGDANEDPDAALVRPDQIQGKVMSVGGYLFVIPLMGYVINFTGTQSGLILLVGLPILLLVFNEIWNVVASTRSEPDDGSGPDVEPEGDTAAATAVDTESDRSETDTSEPTAQPDSTAEGAGGEISFTAAELQLGLGVNAAFLAYSVWVVYSIWTTYDAVETWALGVTGAVGASFLLLGGLYAFGGGDDATDEGTPGSGSQPDRPTPERTNRDITTDEIDSTESETNTPVETDLPDGTVTPPTHGDNGMMAPRSDGDEPAVDANRGDETDA